MPLPLGRTTEACPALGLDFWARENLGSQFSGIRRASVQYSMVDRIKALDRIRDENPTSPSSIPSGGSGGSPLLCSLLSFPLQ